mmetsp:Transcript_48976/g.96036  ORF Transcript_48976/g.96036 Transcript_48976/m.96036 type:complete len:140 (-) Transcript_48976:355-774(-)
MLAITTSCSTATTPPLVQWNFPGRTSATSIRTSIFINSQRLHSTIQLPTLPHPILPASTIMLTQNFYHLDTQRRFHTFHLPLKLEFRLISTTRNTTVRMHMTGKSPVGKPIDLPDLKAAEHGHRDPLVLIQDIRDSNWR